MKRLLMFGITACISCGLVLARAEAAKSRPKRFLGKIQAIDAEAGTLAVKGKKGVLRKFKLTEETTFTKGGKHRKIGAQEIKPGDRARVEYIGDAAVKVHIKVLPAKKKKSSRKGGKKKAAEPMPEEIE